MKHLSSKSTSSCCCCQSHGCCCHGRCPHGHIVVGAFVVVTVIPVAEVAGAAAVGVTKHCLVSLLPLPLSLPPSWSQPFMLPWMPMLSSEPNISATSIGPPTVARDVRTVAVSANGFDSPPPPGSFVASITVAVAASQINTNHRVILRFANQRAFKMNNYWFL